MRLEAAQFVGSPSFTKQPVWFSLKIWGPRTIEMGNRWWQRFRADITINMWGRWQERGESMSKHWWGPAGVGLMMMPWGWSTQLCNFLCSSWQKQQKTYKMALVWDGDSQKVKDSMELLRENENEWPTGLRWCQTSVGAYRPRGQNKAGTRSSWGWQTGVRQRNGRAEVWEVWSERGIYDELEEWNIPYRARTELAVLHWKPFIHMRIQSPKPRLSDYHKHHQQHQHQQEL